MKRLAAAGWALPILALVRANIIVVFYIFLISSNNIAIAAEAPGGTFDNDMCVSCHEKRDNDLVKAWQASAHSKGEKAANCIACHGNSHNNAAVKARHNQTCIACHGGERAPEVHSYATSKHGIIYDLEKREWDWSLPLEQANYRSPGCAYCHMYRGNHNVSATVRSNIMEKSITSNGQDNMRAACQECHSPRYVTNLFDNGEAMLNIGRMKVREAANLIRQARSEFSSDELLAVEQQFKKMRSRHLNNILLGVGHQSPDYQWWHGQPALDGDLIRIKGGITRLKRTGAIADSVTKRTAEPTGQ